jgi:phenylacetate-CoA ligase
MRPRDALTVAAGVASLQRSQWQCAERIRRHQLERLAATLAFALERVPHYRDLGNDTRAREPHTGGPLDRLARFPVLTKHALQTAGRSMLADGVDEARVFRSRTSGSTGEPTTTWFDRRTWLHTRYAVKLRRMLSCGLGPGAGVLIVSEASEQELGGHRKARMTGAGWLFRQEYVSLRAPLASHVDRIRQVRPDALYAFPSYLADLLDHCELEGLELPRVKVVFTSSEMLTEKLRRRLARRLGARVCDVYGCTEFKEVAWQCENGCYHVNHESVWIECEPDAPGSGPGALLLTTLINRAAPLIRYRVGDLGRLQWVECACGREGPALSHLEGREVELLELPCGRRLSPYLLTTAIEDVTGLRHYQFVQTAADRLELRFVALDGSPVDEGLLVSRLRNLLGDELQVQPRPVAEIPRTRGGKRKVFLRETIATADAC